MTAQDLLYKVLDYQLSWARPDVVREKPATVRLAQIEALLAAFGLTQQHADPLVQVKYSNSSGPGGELNRVQYLGRLTNLQYLLQGEFLRDRPLERNQELAERAQATVLAVYGELARPWRQSDLSWLYNHLLNFRQQLHGLTLPERGMLEGFSIGLFYSQELQNQLKEHVRANLGAIDDTLWLLLDPARRDLALPSLVREYGYPDVDLAALDLEWRMSDLDNY